MGIYQLLLIVHVLIAVSLIGLVLMQQGKGAEMGAAFGSGASATIFGARGSASFLMKLTAAMGALFFVTSLSLGLLASHHVRNNSEADLTSQIMNGVPAITQEKRNDAVPTPAITPEKPAPVEKKSGS